MLQDEPKSLAGNAAQRPGLSPRLKREILELVEATQRVLGLRLCFHDSLGRSGLPKPMRFHASRACLDLRNGNKKADEACVAFDMIQTHRELSGLAEGRVQTCPHGFTELAVPVQRGGRMAGVLFAGPCWAGKGRKPHGDLPVAEGKQWLEDRLKLLGALAIKLGSMMEGEEFYRPPDRRMQVEEFIQAHLDGEVTLKMLADELCLSQPRASHVVSKIFGQPFSLLLQEARMRQAALLLVTSDLSVGDIARLAGLPDANYFSRVFRKHYKLPPLAYRKQNNAHLA